MAKVFGWPEFDASGEKILTTYENEYKEMNMDIRVYRMAVQEVREFGCEGEETAVLLLQGKVTFQWNEYLQEVSRKDVFSQKWRLLKRQKFLFSAHVIKQNLRQSFISRRMHPGNIPAEISLEM